MICLGVLMHEGFTDVDVSEVLKDELVCVDSAEHGLTSAPSSDEETWATGGLEDFN